MAFPWIDLHRVGDSKSAKAGNLSTAKLNLCGMSSLFFRELWRRVDIPITRCSAAGIACAPPVHSPRTSSPQQEVARPAHSRAPPPRSLRFVLGFQPTGEVRTMRSVMPLAFGPSRHTSFFRYRSPAGLATKDEARLLECQAPPPLRAQPATGASQRLRRWRGPSSHHRSWSAGRTLVSWLPPTSRRHDSAVGDHGHPAPVRGWVGLRSLFTFGPRLPARDLPHNPRNPAVTPRLVGPRLLEG